VETDVGRNRVPSVDSVLNVCGRFRRHIRRGYRNLVC
jgi:hypothetical protein